MTLRLVFDWFFGRQAVDVIHDEELASALVEGRGRVRQAAQEALTRIEGGVQ